MSRARTKIATDQLDRIEHLLKTSTHSKTKERLLVARMSTTGNYTLAMMAEAVGKARATVQIWLNQFTQGGVDSLIARKKPSGRPTELTEELKIAIQAKLRTGDFRTAGQFRAWLKKEHQLEIAPATSYLWLGKCKGRLKAPRPCHRKQLSSAIETFKTQGWRQAIEALDIPPGEPINFWVMDESRFGLHTIVRHCWGLIGERVVRPFQQIFEWEYLYGAVNIQTGEPVFCHMPRVSSEITWEFLKELEKTKPGEHHVVLWDGAGFHQAPPKGEQDVEGKWKMLEKIHVIKLPAYCPELNPTEKIWDQIKDVVCNEAYESIDALQEAMLPILRQFWEQADGLMSLLSYGKNWLGQEVNAT